MVIAIAGDSGFVGSYLKKYFVSEGFVVVGIGRAEIKDHESLSYLISSSDVVINLMGRSINCRWSDANKKSIYESRIQTTKRIAQAINEVKNKPKVLINTSAVGIYDDTHIHTETSVSYGDGFLSGVCKDWEESANLAKTAVVNARFGVVLSRYGGALPKIALPIRYFAGAIIGNGRQPISWIHIEDLARALKFIIDSNLSGAINMVSPEYTNNGELTHIIAHKLHRPVWFTIPVFLLGLLFKDGHVILTKGQKVLPKRLIEAGFEYKYPNIDKAIASIYP